MKSPDRSTCHVCHLEETATPDILVYRDDHWTILSVQDVPGLLMMFAREHDEGLGALTPAAAASLGLLISTVSAELVSSGDFDRTALLHLGDNSRHSHLLFVGRPDGDQPIADTAALQARIPALKDKARTEELTGILRHRLTAVT